MSSTTSRGVKCSPAVSLESSEKRRIKLLVEVAHLGVGYALRPEVYVHELAEH